MSPVAGARRWRAALTGLFLLALGVRLVVLTELSGFAPVTYPVGDARRALEWARTIAAGDLASRSIGAFYQAPLHPYALAVVVASSDAPESTARYLQAVGGAVASVLLALAAARLFGTAAAAATGILLALSPVAVFHDVLLLKESLGLLLFCALLAAVAVGPGAGGGGRALLAGALLGLFCLVRENGLALVPFVAGWIALRGVHRIRSVLLVLAGLAIPLLPVAARNLAFGGGFAPTTVQGGVNFFIGNNAKATGLYAPLRPGRSDPEFERADATELAARAIGHQPTPHQTSAFFFREGLEWIRSEPGRFAALFAAKALLAVHAFELPDMEDLGLYAEHSETLRALAAVLPFGVLFPLAAAAAVLAFRPYAGARLAVLLACAWVASVAFFYVFARYRFPLIPLGALLAGAGLQALAERRASRARWVAAFLVGMGALVLSRVPLAPAARDRSLVRNNLGVALAGTGAFEEAERCYRRALEENPGQVEASLNLGSLLLMGERRDEAVSWLARARELSPEDPQIAHQLGLALAARSPADGIQLLEEAVRLGGGAAPACDLALYLVRAGDVSRAFRVLEETIRRYPAASEAKTLLARVCLSLPPEAGGNADRALALAREAAAVPGAGVESAELLRAAGLAAGCAGAGDTRISAP